MCMYGEQSPSSPHFCQCILANSSSKASSFSQEVISRDEISMNLRGKRELHLPGVSWINSPLKAINENSNADWAYFLCQRLSVMLLEALLCHLPLPLKQKITNVMLLDRLQR